MPPRLSLLACFRIQHASSFSQSALSPLALGRRPFNSSSSLSGPGGKKHRDPYAVAQAVSRKAANKSRQEVLKKERADALGDPVRGTVTPFIESFDTGLPPTPQTLTDNLSSSTTSDDSTRPPPGPDATQEVYLKHFFSQAEIDSRLEKSKELSAPLPGAQFGLDRVGDAEAAEDARHKQQHEAATAAIARIVSLSNGNSKDRLRANIQRCVATFGRHNTDATLPSKPTAIRQLASPYAADNLSGYASTIGHEPQPVNRAGKDTGSSEVQIAILTAKIRALANFMETRGKGDKVNKRNLRLLVHRRQKLLQYLKRKERGGPRWQHCVDTLGLTEGTWQGEISL